MNWKLDNFFTSILICTCLPLIPLFIEYIISDKHSISRATLFLTAALFNVSIGISSYKRTVFVLSILICVSLSIIYGLIVGDPLRSEPHNGWAWGSIIFFILINANEKFKQHYIYNKPVFNFEKK